MTTHLPPYPPPIPPFRVYRTYPVVFEQTCFKCGKAFKFSWGWRFTTRDGKVLHLCRSCAPNYSMAEKLAKKA